MSQFGFYSEKSPTSISFESHLTGLEEHTKILLLDLRNFTKSLGSSIVEEIRPHRVVYAKSLTFRTFLDIQPRGDSLIISVRKGRTEPARIYTVKSAEESEEVKHQIKEAYKTIK